MPLALRKAEDPLGDDVPLDLRRPRGDRPREAVDPRVDEFRVPRPAGRPGPRAPSRIGRARPTRRLARPAMSVPSSARRWRSSENASLKTLPPTPGTPVRAAWETFRFVSAHNTSSSAPIWPIRRGEPVAGGGRGGDVAQRPQQLHRLEQLADERGTALEAERHHRHPPAIVLVADAIGDRHSGRRRGRAAKSVEPAIVGAAGCRCPACPSARRAT